jgi:energy coupling factor transporter S component ThiW
MQTARLTLSALLIAIGTLTANLFYIPAGISKCFPVQHCINVLAAILLGPSYATGIGFVIALLRNMFGLGSLLAFPGSMIGAFCAGILYARFKNVKSAMFGEIFGTGILGGFVSFLIAQYVLGKATVAWFFIPPFLVSTIGGSAIAGLLIKSGVLNTVMSSSLLRQPSKNTKGGHYV